MTDVGHSLAKSARRRLSELVHHESREGDRHGDSHLLRLDEIADVLGDRVGGGVEGEVAAIDDVHFGVRHIATV